MSVFRQRLIGEEDEKNPWNRTPKTDMVQELVLDPNNSLSLECSISLRSHLARVGVTCNPAANFVSCAIHKGYIH